MAYLMIIPICFVSPWLIDRSLTKAFKIISSSQVPRANGDVFQFEAVKRVLLKVESFTLPVETITAHSVT